MFSKDMVYTLYKDIVYTCANKHLTSMQQSILRSPY